jgi:hypothetical protein
MSFGARLELSDPEDWKWEKLAEKSGARSATPTDGGSRSRVMLIGQGEDMKIRARKQGEHSRGQPGSQVCSAQIPRLWLAHR